MCEGDQQLGRHARGLRARIRAGRWASRSRCTTSTGQSFELREAMPADHLASRFVLAIVTTTTLGRPCAHHVDAASRAQRSPPAFRWASRAMTSLLAGDSTCAVKVASLSDGVTFMVHEALRCGHRGAGRAHVASPRAVGRARTSSSRRSMRRHRLRWWTSAEQMEAAAPGERRGDRSESVPGTDDRVHAAVATAPLRLRPLARQRATSAIRRGTAERDVDAIGNREAVPFVEADVALLRTLRVTRECRRRRSE